MAGANRSIIGVHVKIGGHLRDEFRYLREDGITGRLRYVELFGRTYRDEILNMYVFHTMNEVREINGNWIRQYKKEHPLDSLDHLTPQEYLDTRNPLKNHNCAGN